MNKERIFFNRKRVKKKAYYYYLPPHAVRVKRKTEQKKKQQPRTILFGEKHQKQREKKLIFMILYRKQSRVTQMENRACMNRREWEEWRTNPLTNTQRGNSGVGDVKLSENWWVATKTETWKQSNVKEER